MEAVKKFISNLAERFRKENDLSDITWAMCQASTNFKKTFISFFFPELKNESLLDIVDIQREIAENDSRPDFIFECDGKKYLIENKIWDNNHHFEQYNKTYSIPAKQLGYITAYPMHKDGFNVYTWRDMFKYLKDNLPLEEAALWNGYLDYIQQVCNIFYTEKPMNLDGMFSLFTFFNSLDKIFEISEKDYHSTLYPGFQRGGNGKSSPHTGAMGKYFEVEIKAYSTEKIRGWMGVYFKYEHPEICLCFYSSKDWGKPVYDYFTKNKELVGGDFYNGPYEEDGAIWFSFSKADEFNKLQDVDKQIELLGAFFREIIDIVCKKISR